MKRGENAEYSWNYKRKMIYWWINQLNWQSILDVGCGNGEELGKYVSKYDQYGIGLDINEIKNSNAKNIEFTRGDALHLPIKEDMFDLLTATEIIEHLPNGEQFLRECHRILKDKGHLILSTPNKLRFLYLIALVRKIKKDTETGHGLSFGHINEYTPRTIKKELQKAGFSILFFKYGAISPYVFPPYLILNQEMKIINEFYKLLNTITNFRFLKPLFKGDMIIVAQKNIGNKRASARN